MSAAVTPRAGLGDTEGLVAGLAHRDRTVRAGFVRTTRYRAPFEGLQKAVAFLGNRQIALDRRHFVAGTTMKKGNARTRAGQLVGILVGTMGSRSALDRPLRQNAEVAARRVLAEIDLDTISFVGNAPRTGDGGKIFRDRKIPYGIKP